MSSLDLFNKSLSQMFMYLQYVANSYLISYMPKTKQYPVYFHVL